MSNRPKLPRAKATPPRTDFTGLSNLHLDKDIARLRSRVGQDNVRLSKAGRTRMAGLVAERHARIQSGTW